MASGDALKKAPVPERRQLPAVEGPDRHAGLPAVPGQQDRRRRPAEGADRRLGHRQPLTSSSRSWPHGSAARRPWTRREPGHASRPGSGRCSPGPRSATRSAAPPRAGRPSRSRRATAARSPGSSGPYYEDWRHARPIAPYHKGDGHITDDTLMTHALVQVYAARRTHLDAYAMAERPGAAADRRAGLDPRAGGARRCCCSGSSWPRSGSWPGCTTATSTRGRPGSATSSTAAPPCTWRRSGSSTPANPRGAYAEAIDIAGAHQSSYGREAAGVFAAAVAAALTPGADVERRRRRLPARGPRRHPGRLAAVRRGRRGLAPDADDGDRPRRAASGGRAVRHGRRRLPRPGAGRPTTEPDQVDRGAAGGAGLLLVAGGDFRAAVLGAVNYGRDADSIATMAGAICGALGGPDVGAGGVGRDDRAGQPDRPGRGRRRAGRSRRGHLRRRPRGARHRPAPADRRCWPTDARHCRRR